MTKNLTLAIDEALLHKARVYAAERKTTVNAIVREQLSHLVSDKTEEQKAAIARMKERSANRTTFMTGRTWTRDDIYDERKLFRFSDRK